MVTYGTIEFSLRLFSCSGVSGSDKKSRKGWEQCSPHLTSQLSLSSLGLLSSKRLQAEPPCCPLLTKIAPSPYPKLLPSPFPH